ncbi:NAD(P)-dependent oxidoreductase [Nonomuraea sp. K274]|uniref:NAD(P)-dependent oxidoreductase n=1 Tax=Nonomuraea cypriaca TaxID=1187855 RepID=A0A931AFP8_9ACTN|nr:NAD(P)-dependent oxidoreductase [Nonomuraea cypriaca]MBF8190224.1 NAD(P)-dependent oxidoreductase [Nonomuraea cypriaca]
MSQAAPRVAHIGLGAIGLPMALRLAGAFPVRAYDIDESRLRAAVQGGATAAASSAEAAAGSDIALLAVRDQAQVEAALFGAGGVVGAGFRGVVLLTSTIGPAAVRAIAEQLASAGIGLVDAPVSGGPVRAGEGDLLVLVGATAEALASVRPVLERLASTLTIVGGAAGDGQVFKTINQLLAGVHIAVAAEAIALARGLGVDPQTVISALSQGAGGSFMFGDRGPRMLQAYGDGAEVKSRLDIFVKDMSIVTGVARQTRVATPLAAAAEQLYLLADSHGLGARDDSSVVTLLSPRDDASEVG